ncbi:MAG: alkaline phosphatase family protein [Chloroflexi bacterium]|nr:alkaline phosphatase family protein [Chloroflexota bacterium]MCY3938643.1 alkaline phosphatase family protein [Chloroflexota bacterium]
MAKSKLLQVGFDGMNLLPLRKYEADGLLPNFSSLLERGSANRLLCAIPAWTPTNWATLVTGATAGTHGLGGWSVRDLTKPRDTADIRAEDSRSVGAETIWEVAERANLKSMITFYPASWPPPVADGYVVAPGFRYPPFAVLRPEKYVIGLLGADHQAQVSRETTRAGTDTAETGEEREVTHLVARPTAGGALEAEIRLGRESEVCLLIGISEVAKAGRYTVTAQCADSASAPVLVEKDRWSEWLFAQLLDADGETRRVSFRLRLLQDEVDTIIVVRSEAHRTGGFASPEKLASELVDSVGPFIGMFATKPEPGDAELDACLDEYLYSGLWQARAAKYVMDNHGWDLHFSHWHLFDTINHSHVNPADPGHPGFDAKRAEWHMSAHKRAFEVADQVLGEFLTLADENTYVLVNSDHAMATSHRWGSVPRLLHDHGLIAFHEDGITVDPARSRTYVIPDRGSEIFVNLEGREPDGIVPADQYEVVQEEIIEALHDWRDPDSGKRAVALALKNQDAQVVGFWGPNNGDVFFTLNRGFGWGDPLGEGSIGPGRGALHGSQIPTSEGPVFTNMGCFIISGPGIKGGYERDWQRYGLMRMIDLAPTMALLMGIRPPAHSQGAVLWDLLEDS